MSASPPSHGTAGSYREGSRISTGLLRLVTCYFLPITRKPLITATRGNTLEIIRELEITLRGTCIVGVGSARSAHHGHKIPWLSSTQASTAFPFAANPNRLILMNLEIPDPLMR